MGECSGRLTFSLTPSNVNTNSSEKYPLSQLLAAIVIGVAGTAMFNLSPMVLSAAADLLQLSDQQLGWLMGAEVFGIAIASIVVLAFTRRIGVRKLALAGAAVVALGNLAAAAITDYQTLLALRFAIGCAGDGLLYACAVVVLGRQSSPVRAFAIFSFTNMCIIGAVLASLPDQVGADLWKLLMGLLAGMGVIALVASFQLPKLDLDQARRPGIVWQSRPWMALLGLFAFTLNLGAVWGFAAKVGAESGLASADIAGYLSLSIVFQAAGSLTAIALGSANRPLLRLASIAVLQLLGLLLLALSNGQTSFVIGLALWGFGWNFGIANLLGFLAEDRHGNKVLALAPGTEALGAASGPAIAGTITALTITHSVVSVGLIGAIAALLLFVPLVMTPRYSTTR
ncbi:MAG: hypothetical protein DHS20C11_01160 [Lysobacteraceae bacterium]|nr:MAG: hypothetical protein DHS20C11_01160 [Xanthomonadaceae bacterium]